MAHILIFGGASLASLPAVGAPDFSTVRNLLTEVVDEGKIAGGSVLVMYQGKVVFEEGFGYADLKAKIPFEVDTPAVIASISKPLLGTAAFRLAENGDLDMSQPISEYIPEFEQSTLESGGMPKRAPTMIELFTHTSGLRSDHAPGGRPWFATWTKGKPLAQVVEHYALEYPFKAQPGTKYAYSGIGTDVAARVLEVMTHLPRNEMLMAEVTKPLGMTHTFYRDAESLKNFELMPKRYYRNKGEDSFLLSKKREIPPVNTYSSSGGSIISTAPDLARWLLMIRNGGEVDGKPFLASKTVAKMLEDAPRSKNACGGLFIRERGENGEPVVVGHSGSSGTNCWIDFRNDVLAVVLTQTRGEDISKFRAELEKRVTGIFEK
jgi:CubicO group peptidase (beta-lactamase class C family)